MYAIREYYAAFHPLLLLSTNARCIWQITECEGVPGTRTAVRSDASPQSSNNGADTYRGLPVSLGPGGGKEDPC